MIELAKMSPCIEWDKYRNPKGYGHRTFNGKVFLAHRAAWIDVNGDIPDGLCVLHKCDNPPCVNVEHLFLGTRGDNNRDCVRKGRYKSFNGNKTHCKNGHKFTKENTHVTEKGYRYCRSCKRQTVKRTYCRNKFEEGTGL